MDFFCSDENFIFCNLNDWMFYIYTYLLVNFSFLLDNFSFFHAPHLSIFSKILIWLFVWDTTLNQFFFSFLLLFVLFGLDNNNIHIFFFYVDQIQTSFDLGLEGFKPKLLFEETTILQLDCSNRSIRIQNLKIDV